MRWLFVDESRLQDRRWFSTETAATAKARRYRERIRALGLAPLRSARWRSAYVDSDPTLASRQCWKT
ncbi:CGNR zinc finger domain-containing protein [Mesorhizobium sp. M0185]|uniref:CGNR zinc finger domain-containing protein n=1 Tax=Mesorhizobium sp. M0185 TaxID=2956907 RepID=UPI003335EF2A